MNNYKFEEIDLGLTESFNVIVTQEMHDHFTQTTGDINPMHLDKDYAQQRGFEGVLVYGMLTASFYSTLVGVYLPGKYCLFQEANVKFNKPVYVGDMLMVEGKVIEKDETFRRIVVKAFIKNQENRKVSMAKLTVGLLNTEE
jgi:3-hydroxybutyryl-CoA dehydratase